ncbi:Coiled-coil domain-containing protein [Campylobacter sp. VTCC 70190]|uniref:Coiled-coil domain-containing protein n=1 Tax=Campylobacter sp. VTCC 70190 TaxID=3392118 RepID=UPI00398E6BCE
MYGEALRKDTKTENSSDESKLAALEEELKQAEASLENDFAEYASQAMSEELEELFFEDKKAFIEAILKMQNEFLQTNYNPKLEEAAKLRKGIANKNALASIDSAKEEFLKNNPEADINALMEFYDQELGIKYKKELDKLEPLEFFSVLYEIYKQRNHLATQNDALPRNPNAQNIDADNASFSNDDLPMNRM